MSRFLECGSLLGFPQKKESLRLSMGFLIKVL